MKYCLCGLLFLNLGLVPLAGQLRIQPGYGGGEVIQEEDLWRLQLQWMGSAPLPVRVVSELYDEQGNLLLRLESREILLEPGFQNLHPEHLRVQSRTLPNTTWKATYQQLGAFPAGRYNSCTILLTASDRSEITRHCLALEPPPQAGAANGRPLQFAGSAQIDYSYASRSWPGSEFPRQFIRADLRPEIEWQGIPLGLDLYLTNEDRLLDHSLDAVNLHFDADRFREQLIRSAKQYLDRQMRAWQEAHAPALARKAQLEAQLQVLDQAQPEVWASQLNQLEGSLEQQARAQVDTHLADYREQYEAPQLAMEQKLQELSRQQADSLAAGSPSHELARRIDSLGRERALWRERYREELQHLEQLREQYETLRKKERQARRLKQQLQEYRQQEQRRDYLRRQLDGLQLLSDSTIQSGQAGLAALRDPEAWRRQVQRLGLLPENRRWLLALEKCSLGAHFPDYSPFMLNGTRLNGLQLGWRVLPRLQLMFSGGKIQAPRLRSTYFPTSHIAEGTAMGTKLSWNWPSVGRFYLSGAIIHAGDSLLAENGSGRLAHPAFGWGAQIDALQQQLSGQIEGAVSFRPGNDLTAPSDRQAYRADLQWAPASGHWQASLEWQSIGRAYELPGTPFILPGMQQLDVQFSSRLLDRQLQAGLFYQKDDNRPLGFSPFRLQNHQYGLMLEWQSKTGPGISARLARNLLSQEQENRHALLWNVQLSQAYSWAGLQWESSVRYQQSQQQWHPSEPPGIFSYLEIRQQARWSVWVNTWSVYLGRNGLNGKFSGGDWQSSLQLGRKLAVNLQAGHYRGLIATENGWRFGGQLQWTPNPYMSWLVSAHRDDFFAGEGKPYEYLQAGYRLSW